MWREETISDMIHKCPLILSHPDFQIGVVWDHHKQEQPPHSAPDIQVEQNKSTQNQLSVPSAVETRPERVRTNPSEEVNISPQTDQQREDQSVPVIDEPAPLNIEVGTQRNDVESNEENENNIPPPQVSRSVRPSFHVDDLVLSRNVPWESSNISNPSRGSQIRIQDIKYKRNFEYTTCGNRNIK